MNDLDNVFLGTSGWSYREWIGPFYRKTDKSLLKTHSKVFRTAEINSTFYAYPSKGAVMGWVKYTPEGHVFTAKLPKIITHEKMLDLEKGVEDDLLRFCNLIRPLLLNGKLGSLLIQLPPKFKVDLDHLERFFTILPQEFKFAVEFRHLSWMKNDTWNLLKKYGVAYTIVDEALLPPEVHVTSDFAYFRWHGHGTRPWFNYQYKTEELKPWVPKVREAAGQVKKIYGYFNNHFHGYAVENCLQILEMLGILTSEQSQAKQVAEHYFKTLKKTRTPTLDVFGKSREETLDDLLVKFIDKPRLKRAKKIEDDQLIMFDAGFDRIEAKLKDYSIIIDLKNRLIQHNCQDWQRTSSSKRFCKHVGKLFLLLEPSKARTLLKKIDNEKDLWSFEFSTVKE